MPDKKTEIIFAARTSLKKGMGLLAHKHAYYQFAYVLEGGMTVIVNRKEYAVEKGQCVLYPSGALHEILPVTKDMTQYELKFTLNDPYLVKNVPLVPVVFPGSPEAEAILSCIVDYAHTRTPEDVAHADNFLSALLSRFIADKLRLHEHDSAFIITDGYSSSIKKTLVYIENHFAETFSLSEMAAALSYNPNYLSSAFKKATGISVIDYLNFIRVRHSIIWFSFNALDVTTVYEAAGFSSINHFSRTFRKYVGVSPRQYRKAFPKLFTRDDEGSTFASEPFFMNSRMTMDDAIRDMKKLGTMTLERLADENGSGTPGPIAQMHL